MSSNLKLNEFKISLIQSRLNSEKTAMKRYYIPLTHYTAMGTSFFSTYNESLDKKNNSQYSLTFSINKYNSEELNPLFYLIVENRRLRLERESEVIDFIITGIVPKVTKNNTILDVTCQDVFSYDLSKQNISISYNSLDYNGPLSIGKHATNILELSNLTDRYTISNQFEGGEINNIPVFPNLLTTNYLNSYDEVVTTMEITNTTPYAAFTQLCNDFNALLTIHYPDTIVNEGVSNTKTIIDFSNLQTIQHHGYTVRPETNLTSFSVSRKTDNFCSVLRVSGGEDTDGMLVSLMPSMTSDISNFFTRNFTDDSFWNKTSLEWRNMFYNDSYINTQGNSTRYYNLAFKSLADQKDTDAYWNALCGTVVAGGAEIFKFDYYKESGLLSQEDWAALNELICRDMRNANIKNYLVSSKYFLAESELNILLSAEADYVRFIASDNNVLYNNTNDTNTDSSTEKQQNYKEYYLANYGDNHSYLEDLIEVWSRKKYSYIENSNLLYDFKVLNCDIPGFIDSTLSLNDKNTSIVTKNALDEKYNFTIFTQKNGTTGFSFNYLGGRAEELLLKYNQMLTKYKTYEEKIKQILNSHGIAIPTISDLLQYDEEELYSTLDEAIYSEYCLCLNNMEEIMLQLDECNPTTKTYRMGIITTHLYVLFMLDNLMIDLNSNKLLINSINNLMKSGPMLSLSFDGINNTNLIFGDFANNDKNYTNIWNLYPKMNLKLQKTNATKELSAVWKTLYGLYGDFICESKIEDTDQLSHSGLYTSALKSLASYTQPTVEYSTTVINSNQILGFNASLKLGDVIYFYNKELSSIYNNHLVIEIPKHSIIPSNLVIEVPIYYKGETSFSTQYNNYYISHVIQKNNTTLLYVLMSIDEATQLLTVPFEIGFSQDKKFHIVNKYLDTTAKPIPLQVTGINTKLRDGTSQLTVSNNKVINNLLGKLLRQVG